MIRKCSGGATKNRDGKGKGGEKRGVAMGGSG